MIFEHLVVGAFQCNCLILGCETTKEAVVIDPGDEGLRILEVLIKHNLKVKYLLHTHAHLDHVGATGLLKSKTQSIPCLHQGDSFLYDILETQGRLFGFPMEKGPVIEKWIEDDEVIAFGNHKVKVIHTPGHSPGSVCFELLGDNPILFSGDTLFANSIGRTDLWGGDGNLILKSIQQKLFALSDEFVVFPGHGPKTSIAHEKRHNPFF